MDYKVNTLATDEFSVETNLGVPVTGLVDGNFTKYVYDPTGAEVSGTVPATVVELGNGSYRFSFTPTSVGNWLVAIFHATYITDGVRGSFPVVPHTLEDTYSDAHTVEGRLTATRAGYLDNLTNLDAKVSERATQTIAETIDGKVDIIDTNVDSVLADTTELTDVRLTSGRAANLDNLDAKVSERATQTSVTTVDGKVDIIDTNVDSVLADTTELTDVRLTSGRATNLDNLDAKVSERASQSSLNMVDGKVDILDTNVDAVLVDTDALEGRLTSGRATNLDNLDAKVSERATQISVTTIDGKVDIVDTNVDSVLADTTELTDVRLTSGRATNLDNLDVAITSRESETDAASRAAANVIAHGTTQADIASLNDVSVPEVVNGIWDEAAASHATPGTTGKALLDAGAVGDPAAVWNLIQTGHTMPGTMGELLGNSGNYSPIIKAALVAYTGVVSSSIAQDRFIDVFNIKPTTAYWLHQFITFTTGDNIGQVREIISYNPTTKEIIFDTAFPSTIIPGHEYVILTNMSQADTITSSGATGVVVSDQSPTRL